MAHVSTWSVIGQCLSQHQVVDFTLSCYDIVVLQCCGVTTLWRLVCQILITYTQVKQGYQPTLHVHNSQVPIKFEKILKIEKVSPSSTSTQRTEDRNYLIQGDIAGECHVMSCHFISCLSYFGHSVSENIYFPSYVLVSLCCLCFGTE